MESHRYFSVPNARGKYDVYRSRRGIYSAPIQRPGELGMPIDEALPELPSDASRVGESAHAIGTIATRPTSRILPVIIFSGIAVGCWYYIKKLSWER